MPASRPPARYLARLGRAGQSNAPDCKRHPEKAGKSLQTAAVLLPSQLGGRIDILEQRTVAAIVYQRGKNFINLFVWPATGRKIDIDVQSERGYHFCAWKLAGLNFFCIAEISAADLETFEEEVREKVSRWPTLKYHAKAEATGS